MSGNGASQTSHGGSHGVLGRGVPGGGTPDRGVPGGGTPGGHDRMRGNRWGGRRPWAVAGVVVLLVIVCATVVWAWHRGNADAEIGPYQLPAQSDRRYTLKDMTDMIAACNDPDNADGTKAEFQIVPAGVANATSAANGEEHPPRDINLIVPANEAKDPMRSEGFQCMAGKLGMPDETQRDLVKQSQSFTDEAGAMPMSWNELGFRGWQSDDGTFRLHIIWYDPAASEE
ncbi:hypothetical protein EMB92_10010 [Bifidobacterium callitrichos]|uniref:Uncharacterized protein n=1 Tax=Bifidobacterium callitrichos TaxID=762209 RepID=A0A5M9ZAF9_9BIFI|nr:hypothetical protein [Bifidobacterium callitrichos]KAA8815499.1 hypothetical protein EMB92_10010 [Bifidobacterium callitrichos]